MAMLPQRRCVVLVLLALAVAGAPAEDTPASALAAQSLRGTAAQAGVRGSSLGAAAATAQTTRELTEEVAATGLDAVSELGQVPDYQYFCKHDPDAKSYYSNCSTCVGEVLCCDANQAEPSDKPGSGGKRCTEDKYGVVGLEKCAAREVPPACPYEFFCKHRTDRESYYLKCDESCVDTPICCNTDTTTLDTDLPDSISGGKRCMEGYPGHVSFSMCQARQPPERCPLDKYQYFCKHDPNKQSHYLNCDTCVGEPICCDVDQAAASQFDPNVTGGKRCTKENYGVQDISKCAGQRVPEACQYQYFCKRDPEKMSYYSDCNTCVDAPICCNMETSSLETIFNGTRRCYEGSPGHADFSMCEHMRLPAACPVSTTTTTSTTSTTTSTTTTSSSTTTTSTTSTTSTGTTTSTTSMTSTTTKSTTTTSATTTSTTKTRTTTTETTTTTSMTETSSTKTTTVTTRTRTTTTRTTTPVLTTTTTEEWTNIGGVRYLPVAEKKSWHAALASCQSMGSHVTLATIRDRESQEALGAASLKAGLGHLWIGANDIEREGAWQWVDGAPLAFHQWNRGEPNNAGNEDCAEAWWNSATSGAWNDLPCSVSLAYICEVSPTGSR